MEGDLTYKVAERARAMLRPLLESIRSEIYSGPDTVQMTKAEFRKHIMSLTEQERLEMAQTMGIDKFLEQVG